MGDTFFNGFFPFIDQGSGGTLTGIIGAVEAALQLVDAETKIIPGHGPVASRDDLQGYLDMLNGVRAAMAPLIADGKSREEVIAADPLGELGKTWGNGFMKTDVFTGIVFDVMAGT